MNQKEITHQLQCFDLIEIDYHARISAQKEMLRLLYGQVFGLSDSEFQKKYDELYSENWREYYDSIPVEKRNSLLTSFYADVFCS